MYQLLVFVIVLLGVTACDKDSPVLPAPADIPQAAQHEVSFHDEVRPILEKKCLACHGCFDAPCQLKLESPAGLLRGASHAEVYDGKRGEAQAPTRLNVDANSQQEWQELGFYSIVKGNEASLLYNMLKLGKTYSLEPNSKIPESIEMGLRRENQCVAPENFADYAKDHPLEGMPFVTTGLTNEEYAVLRGWLEQGAKIPDKQISLTENELANLQHWEEYLNQVSSKRQLVSRWLYEHLFLAHIYLDSEVTSKPRFFELVRSYTAPGYPIDVVKTRLPNHDPEAPFFYRLRLIEGATVHKRHILFQFDKNLQQRIETLFFSDDWTVSKLPGYAYEQRANPFTTFAAIPAKARYQFMLDHAEYFTRTFIRGPVCRGQIATDVIRDHFWVFYQDPESDLFVSDKQYHDEVAPLLGLPGQNDDLLKTGKNWDKYKSRRNQYHRLRNAAYRAKGPEWSSTHAIWNGDGENQNALLTIFRHFDGASVQKGLIGKVPETLWWMDYPLLERTYYELVVNFDVFGNVAHQLQTRLYFDLIRNGAEYNMLRLLPPEARQKMVDEWYSGLGAIKTHITYAPLDTRIQTAEQYETKSEKDELATKILTRFASVNANAEDKLNRCNGEHCFRKNQPLWIQKIDEQLAQLSGKEASFIAGLSSLPEMTFLRVKNEQNERTVYSIIRNRAHSNVAFIFGESLRHQPEKDTLTIYPGIAGSYPNFIFDVPNTQIADFAEQLKSANNAERFEELVKQWGVRRTHPDFWEILHDLTAWHQEQQPLEAGVFDINRYANL